MNLIKFPEQTVIIAEHQQEYAPLPAFQFAHDPTGRVTCCWKLSFRERLKLLFTGKLWHTILTFHQPMQPQILELKKPFTPEDLDATSTEKRQAAERKAFEETMLAKYGARARARAKHFDALNYHPNDRRRSIKLDPEDFAQCKNYGLLFIENCRITDENHNSAVPEKP